MAQSEGRVRLGAISLAVASFLLVLFPLLRPFGDEAADLSTQAQAYASPSWAASHSLAAIGLILLPFGFFGLYSYLADSPVSRRAFRGMILGWLGTSCILVVIGVEAFALNVIGQAAIQQNDFQLLSLIDSVRMTPGFVFLLAGLVLLAVGGIFLAVAVWSSSTLPRWSGVLLGVGLALWLPFFPQVIRVADGLLIGAGGIWIAVSILRRRV